MYRFLLTVATVAVLTVAAGIWLDGRLREARRRERMEFELRVERELERPISLAEAAGGDQTLDGVLLHIARQVNVPIVCNRAKLGDDICHKKQIDLPAQSSRSAACWGYSITRFRSAITRTVAGW